MNKTADDYKNNYFSLYNLGKHIEGTTLLHNGAEGIVQVHILGQNK